MAELRQEKTKVTRDGEGVQHTHSAFKMKQETNVSSHEF